MGIKVKPILPGNEITKMGWIQFEGGSADAVVITQRVPIPDGGNDIESALGGNVYRFIPSWVQTTIYDPSFG